MVDPELVALLAKLPLAERDEVVQRAASTRKRRIADAVCRVRAALLPMVSDRAAADIIAAVAHGRRCRQVPLLRDAVERRLRDELGSFDDLPEAERLRQLLREN
jgi:hypothetical protein